VTTYKEVLDDVAELLRQRDGGDADPLVVSARLLISLINDLAVKIAFLERPCRLLEKITETNDKAVIAPLMLEAISSAIEALRDLDGNTKPTEH
jgi:hypothetical protein